MASVEYLGGIKTMIPNARLLMRSCRGLFTLEHYLLPSMTMTIATMTQLMAQRAQDYGMLATRLYIIGQAVICCGSMIWLLLYTLSVEKQLVRWLQRQGWKLVLVYIVAIWSRDNFSTISQQQHSPSTAIHYNVDSVCWHESCSGYSMLAWGCSYQRVLEVVQWIGKVIEPFDCEDLAGAGHAWSADAHSLLQWKQRSLRLYYDLLTVDFPRLLKLRRIELTSPGSLPIGLRSGDVWHKIHHSVVPELVGVTATCMTAYNKISGPRGSAALFTAQLGTAHQSVVMRETDTDVRSVDAVRVPRPHYRTFAEDIAAGDIVDAKSRLAWCAEQLTELHSNPLSGLSPCIAQPLAILQRDWAHFNTHNSTLADIQHMEDIWQQWPRFCVGEDLVLG